MADVIDYGPTIGLSDELSKGKPRGGRYYRRVRTGDPMKPWKYYYTKAAYEREHGDDAHLHGPEVAQGRKESPMGKPMLIVKSGGEGSRGGHVTGHTKSGKPIYAVSAVSGERYRGGAAEKRQYGGSGTITKFHIHDPQTGKHHEYEGHGPTPSARRENALQQHARAVGVHETHEIRHSDKAKKKHHDDVSSYAQASVKATEASERAHESGKHEDHAAAIEAHEHAKSKSGAIGESTGRYHERAIAEHRAAMQPKKDEHTQSLFGDTQKSSIDVFDRLERLVKAAGGERAGHKYVSRKKNGSGGYDYVYAHPKTGAHVGIHTVPGASLGGVTTRAFIAGHGLAAPVSAMHTPSPEAHEEKNTSVKSPHPPGISHGKNHKGEQADEHEKGMLEHALRDTHPKHIERENKTRSKWGKPPIEGGESKAEKPKKSSAKPGNRSDYEHAGSDDAAYERELERASAAGRSKGSTERRIGLNSRLKSAADALDDSRRAGHISDEEHEKAVRTHQVAAHSKLREAQVQDSHEEAHKHLDAAEKHISDLESKVKKSEAIMNSVPSTIELRAAFRGLDGPMPLAKGLYKFESYGYSGPGGRTKDETLPDEYLMVYLDAFIEEAFEHEKCEKMHTTDNAIVGPGPALMGSTQGDEADFWAPFIMNELVTYIVKNKNLMRACEKHNCNAQYIADRLREMNLVKPMASHATMHGDFMEAYMDSEKRTMDSVGKSLTAPGAGTVVSEEEMFKAVAHGQRLSQHVAKTVQLEADDDPITSLKKFHEKRYDDIERVFYGDDEK